MLASGPLGSERNYIHCPDASHQKEKIKKKLYVVPE